MSSVCIYVELDPYLAQWYVHECGGEVPPQPPRGSIESIHLETFLMKTPQGVLPSLPGDRLTAIALPSFRLKDPRVYNYLPRSAMAGFVRILRDRFDLQLWRDLYRFGNIGKRQDDLIYAWMETHGIEPTEANWNAIAKRYQRKRNLYKQNRKNRKK